MIGKITGQLASIVNTELSESNGFDYFNSILNKHKLFVGPKFKDKSFFLIDENGYIVGNAYVSGNHERFRILPLKMEEHINAYKKKKSKVINQAEAYSLWQDSNGK